MVTLQVTDPCHVKFTHHGVQGRREYEKGSHITVTTPMSTGGFKIQYAAVDITFQAPCLVTYYLSFFASTMILYVVPTKTGHCRMITNAVNLKLMTDNSKPTPLKPLISKVRGGLRFEVMSGKHCMHKCTLVYWLTNLSLCIQQLPATMPVGSLFGLCMLTARCYQSDISLDTRGHADICCCACLFCRSRGCWKVFQ